jgi:glutamate formiminotransferase
MSVVCIPNLSEGQDRSALQRLTQAANSSLLDLHFDADHNRCVVTLGGETLFSDLCKLAKVTAAELDITHHRGVHPRLGVIDVVPFIPLTSDDIENAHALAGRFMDFLVEELEIPVFRYDSSVDLPTVRRRAFKDLSPSAGPSLPHPRLGATALACRPPLVAYNIIVGVAGLEELRTLARSLRSPTVRTLGFEVTEGYQLSSNLLSPHTFGPLQLYQAVLEAGVAPISCELVGLVPEAVLQAIPEELRPTLNLNDWSSFEARLSLLEERPT